MNINNKEKKVLEFLAGYYNSDLNCVFFKYIAEKTKITIKEVRRACRSLARKGLTEYITGLFDEEGFVAGSGYCCTKEGAEFKVGWRPGIVLDPFSGAGTVAVVAKRYMRNYLGIELNEDYIKIAKKRIRKQPVPLL